MNDNDIKKIQATKRAMVKRFVALRSELNTLSENDLLLMRTSNLEEFGKLLREVVDYKNSLK